MFRLSGILLLLLIACAVLAAPALKDGWERPIDPDNDCKIAINHGTVTMELPGTDHDLAPKRKLFNAPRLLRDVEGDFLMQVRVSGSFRPSLKSSVAGEEPSVAAGLVLIPTDGNCIRLEYGVYRKRGEQHRGANYRMRGERIYNMEMWGWMPWKQQIRDTKEEQIYLRLERRGVSIYHFISSNGEKWEEDFNVEDGNLPRKVKVGLAACSTSTEPFKVRFDHFKLTRGETKSK